jgi:hypothetical protein
MRAAIVFLLAGGLLYLVITGKALQLITILRS